MEISWFGQSCFRLKSKNAQIICDPFDPATTGLKKPKLSGDVVTVSHTHPDHNATEIVEGDPIIFWGPGEYEVKGARIKGIGSFHDNKEGKERGINTIFTYYLDGVTVCHLGDLGHQLSSTHLEQLGSIDILLVPVGGVYTIDASDAVEVIGQLEPKIVIPMHYAIPGLKFELGTVEAFFKAYGQQITDPEQKLSMTAEKLPDVTQVMRLEY